MTESEKENATEMSLGEFAKEFSLAMLRNVPVAFGAIGIGIAFLNAAQTGYKEQNPIEATASISDDQNIITVESQSWDLSLLNSIKKSNIRAYIISESLVCEFSQTTDNFAHAIPRITKVASCASMTVDDVVEASNLIEQIERTAPVPSANIA
jgi:hypothetical protein